eukprot:445786_1
MPEPRHTMDLGDGAIGGGGGAAMFASYMAGSGTGGGVGGNQGRRGGGRNQPEFLSHRAKERMDMRMMEDGDNTWRGRTVERERTRPNANANGNGAAIVLSLVWNRSPSPPVDKKRGKKAKESAPRTKSKSRSRSRSSSVSSSSTASSSGSSSRSSYSSSSSSDSDSYSSVSRRRNGVEIADQKEGKLACDVKGDTLHLLAGRLVDRHHQVILLVRNRLIPNGVAERVAASVVKARTMNIWGRKSRYKHPTMTMVLRITAWMIMPRVTKSSRSRSL